jgi:hypothetical protein
VRGRLLLYALIVTALAEFGLILDQGYETKRLKQARAEDAETTWGAVGATDEYYCNKLRQHGIQP